MNAVSQDWSALAGTPARFDPEELARLSAKFDRTIRRRNWREYGAAALVVALNLYWAFGAEGLAERIAMLLIAGGALFAAVMIALRGTPPASRLTQPIAAALAGFREDLARQERLLTQVPRTYIAPLVPGLVLLALAPLIDGTASSTTAALTAAGLLLAVVALVFAVVIKLNAAAARRLRDLIRKLDEQDAS